MSLENPENLEKNKLGLTLKDYTCKKCGYVHASAFDSRRILKQCYRCKKPLNLKVKTNANA